MSAETGLPGASQPVDEALPQLLAALQAGSCAVLSAAPGAGKTTRVPFALAAAPWCDGMVVVLEPRRIAARAAAGYMAAQLRERPGETVGYRVRLESRASSRTRILFVTEGVFARMIMDDPELSGVGALIFDEFHERSLDADLGLALVLDVQRALRPELRVLVMSATLETAKIAKMLGDAPVIESPGRSFDVELRYEERGPNEPIEDAVARNVRRALAQEEGSVLAFLPGQKEIRRTAERLGAMPAEVRLFQLYGAVDPREQDEAIRPPGRGERKVVLATAIAETSLTIDGVRIVVDSGLKRVPRYEARTGLTRLETVRASRSAIAQRAGRAGRTAPGIAIRLWREQQNSALPLSDTPEILEADLAGLALDLAAWGVTDPAQLSFLDLPPAPAWAEAIELLKRLGALDSDARITPTGKAMRELPLPPRFAHMVVEAGLHGQALDAAMLAVLASERGLGGNSTDLAQRLDRLRAEKGERANAARGLARSIAHGLDHAANAGLSAGALLSLAWPDRIARLRGSGGTSGNGAAFRLANGRGAVMDQAEPLARSPWLVIADMQGTAAAPRILSAAAIEPAEIEILHGDAFVTTREVTIEPQSGRIRVRLMRRLGTLALGETPGELTPADEPHAILFAHLRERGLDVLDWGKAASRLRDRLMFLHARDPSWPDVCDAALLAGLEDWLLPFLGLPKALSDITPQRLHEGLAFLVASAGKSIAEADRRAPEHFTTPAGSHVPIRYEENAAYLAVRVQELFGLARHPAIMDGAFALTLELLSPAHRPIQVTRDLPGFWKGSWVAVRSEMRGRYPRHPWPEDPANAAPTTRAKPRGT
jgi:ATP-dependent helicase HrpB